MKLDGQHLLVINAMTTMIDCVKASRHQNHAYYVYSAPTTSTLCNTTSQTEGGSIVQVYV
jgi:hypothetical protein